MMYNFIIGNEYWNKAKTAKFKVTSKEASGKIHAHVTKLGDRAANRVAWALGEKTTFWLRDDGKGALWFRYERSEECDLVFKKVKRSKRTPLAAPYAVGQKYRTRDKSVVTYKGKSPFPDWPHEFQSVSGRLFTTTDSGVVSASFEAGLANDILEVV